MKRRNATIFAVFVVLFSLKALGQIQYARPVAPNCSLQTNTVITCVGYEWMNVRSIQRSFLDGTHTTISPYAVKDAGSSIGSGWYFTRKHQTSASISTERFNGLANISIGNSSATFKTETPAVGMVVSNPIPANVLVIPASALGNVQIILES